MLQRVDPNREDIGPLSESLRRMDFQADFRTPMGFQNVYRVPGRDDLLMRASGAVYAVFPQSVYVATGDGLAATVPPGTVFSIGQPGPWLMPLEGSQPAGFLPQDGRPAAPAKEAVGADAAVVTAVQGRVIPRRSTFVVGDAWDRDGAPQYGREEEADVAATRREIVRAMPPDPSTFLKTIVTDEAYRCARLAELLQRAALASRDG
jgi:hypothetical protein